MTEDRLRELVALTGVALVTVIVIGALMGSRSVATDLEPAATEALSAAGLDMVAVSFEGREAELAGGTRQDLVRAESVVAHLRGVRRVGVPGGDVAVPAPPAPSPADKVPTLVLRRTADGLEISGTVADAEVSAELKARAAEEFGVPVRGDLAIRASVGAASWGTTLPKAFSRLVDVAGLTLQIDGSGSLWIGGTVGSRAAATVVQSSVAAAVPGLDVVTSGLIVKAV
ncbi:hypothetical protein [Aeromicrobium sp.]|uniref:hypothetical protein n=1 Tax=Aeromicrobium sp. TaxID=1871063 RepID=UPI00199B44C5|nr:hypothetical protein [Aeromicrobium sp.]MBC7633624.1 hypothetical protein [Aeromicrobium sp.]